MNRGRWEVKHLQLGSTYCTVSGQVVKIVEKSGSGRYLKVRTEQRLSANAVLLVWQLAGHFAKKVRYEVALNVS